MSTYRPYLRVNKNTIQKELANVPRYDIDGRRYGSTLTDDMISIKNPKIGNRHTPVSYDYLNDKDNWVEDHAIPPDFVTNLDLDNNSYEAVHESMAPTVRGGLISRKKFISEGVSEPYTDYEDVYESGAGGDFMGAYTKALLDKKAFNELRGISQGDSVRDDVRYIRSNGRTYHDRGDQVPRWDAEYDPAVGTSVNYNLISPNTTAQLYNMGVDRPESEDLSGILRLYKYYLDNLKS